MQTSFHIKKIAVLGAGVMGSQIAAHCVNAGFEVLLFDLEAQGGHPNAIVEQAIAHLGQLKPNPLATPTMASLLRPCNYASHLPQLSSCDLIIEAVAERLDIKTDLYHRIVPYLSEQSLIVSNTSGLSIHTLAQALPEAYRQRFCGVHFFNPPRYMHLVELIPSVYTPPLLLDALEMWLTRYLGKGVVRAKDTPNFIANRIGVFSLLITLYHAKQFKLGFDEVDALTGTLLGRPKSATFRTLDVVGLDTMQHVVNTMHQALKDDPWYDVFALPEWLCELIEQGHFGQKTGQGIYRKQGKNIEVYDASLNQYRLAQGIVDEEVQSIFKIKDPIQRMQQIIDNPHPQAQFLKACLRDLFHYSAFHLASIADTTRDVDLALRWGFGWQQGPFETWQMAGVNKLAEFIDMELQKQQTFASAALPTWLTNKTQFYTDLGAFSPHSNDFKSQRTLPVYQRQFFPDSAILAPRFKTKVLFENEGVCLSYLQDDIVMANFKSKGNVIGEPVLEGLHASLDIAEKQYQGMIIYQHDLNNFGVGADLRAVASLIQAQNFDGLTAMIEMFQQLMQRIKYSVIPIVAAVRGRALGASCELMLHCDAVVSNFETYPGLVELGVGLIPAGGGCKEMAVRIASKAGKSDLMSGMKLCFDQIAKAYVANNALDAQKRSYLRENDRWVMHSQEVLYAALTYIKSLLDLNYLPPQPMTFPVAGREGLAEFQMGLVNWLKGGFISEYDYSIARELAAVLCGGDINYGTYVDEAWLLNLEKQAFINLAKHPLTQARIQHMLETGKPLRN